MQSGLHRRLDRSPLIAESVTSGLQSPACSRVPRAPRPSLQAAAVQLKEACVAWATYLSGARLETSSAQVGLQPLRAPVAAGSSWSPGLWTLQCPKRVCRAACPADDTSRPPPAATAHPLAVRLSCLQARFVPLAAP